MPQIQIIRVAEEHSELHQYRATTESESPPVTSFERLGISYCAMSSEGPQDPIDNLTPDEANRIIHSHRKVRYGTSFAPPASVCTDFSCSTSPHHMSHLAKEI